jgi:hypothetical protein
MSLGIFLFYLDLPGIGKVHEVASNDSESESKTIKSLGCEQS